MRLCLSALIVLALASSLPACVRRFEEARPDEPHAIVKVRVVHHAIPGPQLDESVRWNGYGVALPPASAGVPRESLRAVRVRPELSSWRFGTTYFHTVVRQEMRTEYRSEQYSCGTETTGYGNSRSTRTRYCSRQVPYQRWVTVTDRIVDGRCDAALQHMPLVNGIYLVQYDYFGGDRCSAQCFRQLPATDGSFRLLPCGAGEPPADAMVATAGSEVVYPPPPSAYEVQAIEASPGASELAVPPPPSDASP